MSQTSFPDSARFLDAVQPLLEARDVAALAAYLGHHYTADHLCAFLCAADRDVCKVAALSLALVGDAECIPALVDRLRDPDAVINQMAEHALWNVWFRGGTPQANHELAVGARSLSDREFGDAFAHFNRALVCCPDFAEAYDQRGMAYYLMDRFEAALLDYRKAVELMPCHFSAWAGLGHCYAHLDMIPQAIEAYEQVRELHPHLDGIAQALGDVRRLAARRENTGTSGGNGEIRNSNYE
ncbi:MAG: tetratricopeptide repeat protein [Tepidisphaerales bacterium]